METQNVLLMKTGGTYNKLRLHRKGYFREILAKSEEISFSICPLLKLCCEHIHRSIQMDAALVRSLERDSTADRKFEATADRARRECRYHGSLGHLHRCWLPKIYTAVHGAVFRQESRSIALVSVRIISVPRFNTKRKATVNADH